MEINSIEITGLKDLNYNNQPIPVENLEAQNIKQGVTILGVTGTLQQPTGTLTITQAGTYDVTNYASVIVDIS